MQLGSKEHKQLLVKGILKVALKTMLLGLVVGVVLILPSFLRENAFSTGLAYLGDAIIIGSMMYAIAIAYQKYLKIIKPFAATFKTSDKAD
jgi:O-antigen/teichoic acid export membrane protein